MRSSMRVGSIGVTCRDRQVDCNEMAAYHVPHQTPSDVIIAIEGIDGAGKRTQTHLLKQQMETHGIKAGVVSFPRYGETFMAGTIADYLNGRFGEIDALPAHFPALLYAVDRFESRELIGQLLQENDVLLADRYVASNLAYQAAKLPSSAQEAFIAWLSAAGARGLRVASRGDDRVPGHPRSRIFRLGCKEGRTILYGCQDGLA